MTGKDKGRDPECWWQCDDCEPVAVPGFTVDDVDFCQPVGFVWFQKPRYRIKAGSRERN